MHSLELVCFGGYVKSVPFLMCTIGDRSYLFSCTSTHVLPTNLMLIYYFFLSAAMKLLNPVALFRSASSRSSSSRCLVSASTSRDEGYESNSDFSDDSCMFSGSHQSTLDRLYAWEKKLYNEVRVCI